MPLERLLIETDAPDMMPALPADATRDIDAEHPVNEPANLIYVLQQVAELRSLPVMDAAEQTWENASRLFAGSVPPR